MARIDTTPNVVLDAVARTLRDALRLEVTRCYLAVDLLNVKIPPGGEVFLAVGPGASSYDEGLEIGGGPDQICENMTVAVGIFSRMHKDRANWDQHLLQDKNKGLWEFKRRVLRALGSVDLTDDSGNTFLRRYLLPTDATAPDYDPEKQLGFLIVNFSAEFDWDLTDPLQE